MPQNHLVVGVNLPVVHKQKKQLSEKRDKPQIGMNHGGWLAGLSVCHLIYTTYLPWASVVQSD